MNFKRRHLPFVFGLGGFFLSRAEIANAASAVEAQLSATPPENNLIKKKFVSPENCYFTYPHSNGFNPFTGNPVIGQQNQKKVTFMEWNFRDGSTLPIMDNYITDMYFDISSKTGKLYTIQGRHKIASADLSAGSQKKFDQKIEFSTPQHTEALLSSNKDGSRILYGVANYADKSSTFYEVDIRSQKSDALFTVPFNADHQTYSPYDENWIGFAHEGDIRQTLDVLWGVNRSQKPLQPRKLWDEHASDGGTLLAGHQRWAFDRVGALLVAYPDSPGRPRGLYFVDPVENKTTLISASAYDWHCNISRDGKWAVVDTEQPHDLKTDAQGRRISDIVLVNMRTGQRHWLARSHTALQHPWHPHPHFSPDGDYVIYNDYQHDGSNGASRTIILAVNFPT